MPSRRLAAIMFADIAGYTAIMQKDEQKALDYLTVYKQTMEEGSTVHKGEIIQFWGDGCLILFDSALDSVQSAIYMQKKFWESGQIPVRIGLHLGDVIEKDGNAFGDAVNLTARIESMGIAGSILLSESLQKNLKNQPNIHFESMGSYTFKNVEESIEVYAVREEGIPLPQAPLKGGKQAVTSPPIPKTSPLPSRRKPIQLVALAVVFLLGAYLAFSFFSQKPPNPKEEKELILSQDGPLEIGVYALQNTGKDTSLNDLLSGISNLISIDLSQFETVKATYADGNYSSYQKIENAKMMNRPYYIDGTYEVIQDSILLTVDIHDAKNGEELHSFSLSEKDLWKLVDATSKGLSMKLLEASVRKQDLPIKEMTSSNPEALKNFLKASNLPLEKRLPFYEKAIEADSTFVFANWSYFNLLQFYSDKDEETKLALDRAFRYRRKLPKKWQDEILIEKYTFEKKWKQAEELIRYKLDKIGYDQDLYQQLMSLKFSQGDIKDVIPIIKEIQEHTPIKNLELFESELAQQTGNYTIALSISKKLI
ncbi:MAG: adenylate/guanylate cyclase domain-containing protein [Bacteroidota bacterium]